MSDSLGFALAILVGELLPALICLYAAYWAFSIRGALAGRIYRRHAFWLGVIGVLFAMIQFLTYSTNATISDLLVVFFSVLFPLLFAVIDSTIPVARRSDPLARPILRWGRTRAILWAEAVALAFVNGFPYILPASFVNSDLGVLLANVLWPALAISLFGVSAVALVVGARRSRDLLFQGSLKWLGGVLLVVICIFIYETALFLVLPNLTQFDFYYSYYAVPSGILSAVAGYALYRSARSMAPINRLHAIESVTISAADVGTS